MSEQIFDLDGMTPEEIARATNDGRLSAMLEGDPIRIAQEKAIAEREAIEAAAEEAKPAATVDQGARGTAPSDKQVTAAELSMMSPEEVARATRQGRLTDLLS